MKTYDCTGNENLISLALILKNSLLSLLIISEHLFFRKYFLKLKGCLPQILLGPFLNILSHMYGLCNLILHLYRTELEALWIDSLINEIPSKGIKHH